MEQEEHHRSEERVRLVFKGLIPIILFIGGIVVLVSGVAGWNMILGIPITIIGLAILINVFDEISSFVILPKHYLASCAICGKATPALPGIPENDTICAKCKREIKQTVNKE